MDPWPEFEEVLRLGDPARDRVFAQDWQIEIAIV